MVGGATAKFGGVAAFYVLLCAVIRKVVVMSATVSRLICYFYHKWRVSALTNCTWPYAI